MKIEPYEIMIDIEDTDDYLCPFNNLCQCVYEKCAAWYFHSDILGFCLKVFKPELGEMD